MNFCCSLNQIWLASLFLEGIISQKIYKHESISYYSVRIVVLFMIPPKQYWEPCAYLHWYPCGIEDSNQMENGLKRQIFSHIYCILRQVIWRRTLSPQIECF